MGRELADRRRSALESVLPRVPADDAVTGITTALFVAIAGAAPWALGVLIYSHPAAWQSAAGRYSLLLAQTILLVTAVVVGVGVLRSRVDRDPAAEAARARAIPAGALSGDRHPAAEAPSDGAGLDGRAAALLRRAQDAVRAVTSAEICRDGLLDEPSTTAALAAQQSEIADALREQARLSAERSWLAEPSPGSPAAELLEQHRQAARAAHRSIAARVAALERYAAEVRQADADYRDWRQHAAISELTGPHLDMLARTAADEYRIAELTAMIDQARSVRRALREPRD
ncbi:MAG: hypothetical protein ABSA02_34355 [Trebonia sp.]